jgi:hypothetical protein
MLLNRLSEGVTPLAASEWVGTATTAALTHTQNFTGLRND